MKVQSLSICVPGRCPNDCAYCVAKLHPDTHRNMLDENLPFYHLYLSDYINRLEFARDNGCNTAVLTGDSEPLANRSFLKTFGVINRGLSSPFRWIELQTSGIMLDEAYLRFLRNHVQVNTISLSICSFDSAVNASINGIRNSLRFSIGDLCKLIRKYDFNLRLSINMTDWFDRYKDQPAKFFSDAKELSDADQITCRVLYTSGMMAPQDEWIEQNRCSITEEIDSEVVRNGNPLNTLPFGATKYDYEGMSVVVDKDCMSQETTDSYKYLILRQNCKLYSRWDSDASLIF